MGYNRQRLKIIKTTLILNILQYIFSLLVLFIGRFTLSKWVMKYFPLDLANEWTILFWNLKTAVFDGLSTYADLRSIRGVESRRSWGDQRERKRTECDGAKSYINISGCFFQICSIQHL